MDSQDQSQTIADLNRELAASLLRIMAERHDLERREQVLKQQEQAATASVASLQDVMKLLAPQPRSPFELAAASAIVSRHLAGPALGGATLSTGGRLQQVIQALLHPSTDIVKKTTAMPAIAVRLPAPTPVVVAPASWNHPAVDAHARAAVLQAQPAKNSENKDHTTLSLLRPRTKEELATILDIRRQIKESRKKPQSSGDAPQQAANKPQAPKKLEQDLLRILVGSTQAPAAVTSSNKDQPPRGRAGTFTRKLHQMLEDMEKNDTEHIASFLGDGKSFIIHDPVAFAKEILPKYFGKMGSFTSFQRQLNLYDFVRVRDGPNRGAYHHERFVKGRPEWSLTMRRTKIKGLVKPQQQQQQQQQPSGSTSVMAAAAMMAMAQRS